MFSGEYCSIVEVEKEFVRRCVFVGVVVSVLLALTFFQVWDLSGRQTFRFNTSLSGTVNR